MTEFTVKYPVTVFTQTAHEICHVVINVLRKPILSGPLESDIVTVRDMSEITTENKVYLGLARLALLATIIDLKVQCYCRLRLT